MNSENDNNCTPRLRFPGFTGEWLPSKIGEVATVFQGFGFPNKYQGQKNGELPFCKVGDISATVDIGEKTIYTAANYVDYSLLPELHAKPIPVGATIFAKIGEAIRSNKRVKTGVACLIDNNAAAVKAGDTITDDFLFYVMSQISLTDYSGGIVPSVNKSTIEAIPILLPPTIEEQEKIALCLSEIDELIAAQGRNVDALKERKRGLMQQLFPKPGETIPRLRFPGFTGEWEEKKLGDVAKINPKTEILPEDFIYIDLDSVEGGTLLKKNHIRKINAPSRAQRLLKDGDILFQMVRPYQKNNFHFIDINDERSYVASTGYAQIRYEACSKYLYQFLHTELFVNQVVAKCVGGNYPAINTTDLSNIPISLPSFAEQEKIASILSELDALIAAESTKLDTLKKHKKGLLQQLFPQPTK